MSIGENIKAARKALKMSQDDLAEKTGANRVTISQSEAQRLRESLTTELTTKP